MYNIVAICLVRPHPLVKYGSHFLVRATDSTEVSCLKFEVLPLLFPHCEAFMRDFILSELEHFTRGSSNDLVKESVRAIGRCAQMDSSASARCMKLLLRQIASQDDNLVAESLTVIRHLIQQDPQAHKNTITRLAKNLDTMKNPQARATIIWLVGEYSSLPDGDSIAPDVLRILAKGFAEESEAAKLQIVLLAAKVYLQHLTQNQPSEEEAQPVPLPRRTASTSLIPGDEGGFQSPQEEEQMDGNQLEEPESQHPVAILWRYILLLVRYDTSYDLRDRTRVYRALLADPKSTQLASLLLLAPKPVPHAPSPSESRKDLLLGSSSLVIGTGPNGLPGYEKLPKWVQEGEEPDPKLRDERAARVEYEEKRDVPAGEILDAAARIKSKAGIDSKEKGKEKDQSLDDWLDEESEEESSEEETESEEEEEEESEEASTDNEESAEEAKLVSS